MKLWLEFHLDMAVLHVWDRGHRTEVRGHPGVGTVYMGDRLDRVLAALPRRVNVSLLFADQVATCWGDDKEIVREALRREDEMTAALLASKMASPPAKRGPLSYRRRDVERLRAGSFNGRTPDFGSGNEGSTPSPAAKW